MFNYSNLSSKDFENICKDILEKQLDIKLRTFANGPDGGIDIKGFISNDIIGQGKLYLNQSTTQAVDNVKKELVKIKKIDPKKYFIFVGRELTPKNITDIYNHFIDYMENESFVWDLNMIDDFLKNNKDVLLKHHKLWMESADVLTSLLTSTIDFQTQIKIKDYLDQSKFFVKTKFYHEAINLLEKFNVVLLHGDAGVGKTTLSEMILNLFQIKGYEILYQSNDDYSKLFEKLSSSEDVKQIILLDDFLGQRYSELKEKKVTPILHLINYVLTNPNKKLILNSRITVLNDAKSQYENFNSRINHSRIQKYELNMNNLTDTEKGLIFLNNMRRFNVSDEHYEDIRKYKRYKVIVRHKNYNPRAIEYVSQNFKMIPADHYYAFIIETLKDSFKVWENEYDYKIEEIDRILIQTIYTLGNKDVPEHIVIECFNQLLSKLRISGGYQQCFRRLEKSFITLTMIDTNRFLKLKNPSIYDFLDKKSSSDYSNLITILDNSLYLEQVNTIFWIMKKNNIPVKDNFDKLFLLKRFDNNSQLNPLIIMKVFTIKHKVYKKYLENIKSNIETDPWSTSYMSLCLNKELIDYYEIDIYDTYNDFSRVFLYADLNDYLKGLMIFNERNNKEIFNHELTSEIYKEINYRIDDYYDDNFDSLFNEFFDKEKLYFPEEIEYSIDNGNYSIDYIPSDVIDDLLEDFTQHLIKSLVEYISIDFKNLRTEWVKCIDSYQFSELCNKISLEDISQKFIEVIQYGEYMDYMADEYREMSRDDSLESIFEDTYNNK